ncbi:MAG: hypothetical protein IPK16_06295 [Anaerolineales bacterium]|nr:hypothetical protein [Anaerolineales bacterium]
MQQTKISLTPPLSDFLGEYKRFGFKDKSDMVRSALNRLRAELETQSLRESAELYAAIYASDRDLQELTNAAQDGWPEP